MNKKNFENIYTMVKNNSTIFIFPFYTGSWFISSSKKKFDKKNRINSMNKIGITWNYKNSFTIVILYSL